MDMDRKTFIGGSDIAAVMGISRWKSPLMLWAEKIGQIEPADLSDVEAVQLGTELEEFVAKKFERVTGMDVRRSPKYYTHHQHEFMKCQVDRLVTGTDELLECKTASLRKEKEWAGDEIPQEYIVQVQWQLMITGRKVGHIACLIGGQKFVTKRIEADGELFQLMTDAALKFWQMVQDKTAPMAVGMDNDSLVKLYPKSGWELKAVEELNDDIVKLQDIKQQIIRLDKEKDSIEARIKQVIGDDAGLKTSLYTVKWSSQETKRIDVDAVKAAGLFDQFAKSSFSRVMRVTANKGVAVSV